MVLAVKTEDLWVGYISEEEDVLWAVRGVDIEVSEGEIYCIVGESGCGKSTLGNTIVGILPPYSKTRGKLEIMGKRIVEDDYADYSATRGRIVTLIPQNPGKALNPYLTVEEQFHYVLSSLHGLTRREARRESRKFLEMVGLVPDEVMDKYPHELSGGMQQRAAIALALATGAKIIVADEPTSALDANLRLHFLKLMKDLRDKLLLTIIMITHDLLSASRICGRITVMYAGRIVEEAETSEIMKDPKHPYTKMLIDAVPILGVKKKLVSFLGEPPRPGEYLPGCQFSNRCPYVTEKCRLQEPPLIRVNNRRIACWLYGDRNER